ncbi:nitrate reductase [Vibrio maerlii]|uniref:nitrate reductase n=1 Tax=Vibrio maerlii TaxID=2231648 RepID=UPI000E3E9BEE|nr:nitrate reductase [Vibrio maerlii]
MSIELVQGKTKTACPYCGVGCGVEVSQTIGKTCQVKGDSAHPANQGKLCVKGSALSESLQMPSRLLYPKLKNNDGWSEIEWGAATDLIAEKIHSSIDAHGSDSVAMYVSGQLLTEDYYVANKLMKGFVGSANIDTNSRLCMSSAVVAHTRAFGEDLVPVSYEDVEKTDLLVIVGANTAWTHPVLYRRIQEAKQQRPEMKIVVIDPRETVTAQQADLHLPISNDSDIALFNGLLAYCVANHAHDEDYINKQTENFAEIFAECRKDKYQLQPVANSIGLEAEVLETFYRWFAEVDSAVTLFCQGVNQSEYGSDKANAIINVHLSTGKIGRGGCGPFSITGQPNAMGGREVGGLANQLAAHRGFDAQSIGYVSKFWNAPNMAKKPGLKAVELFQAVERGDIKVIWIMATNPVVSMPDTSFVKRALEQCECVIVSDITEHSDITQYADILLPASGWGEKEGMVTNSERMLSRQRAFTAAPGEAKPDWWAISQVGQKLCRHQGVTDAFAYQSPADIFREHAQLSAINNDSNLKFDLSSLSTMTELDYQNWQPKAWPFDDNHPLDSGYSTPSGKAQFVLVSASDQEHSGWWLNSGRQRDQWHTMTRTGHIESLSHHESEPTVYMSQSSMDELELVPGQLLEITSKTNQALITKADVDEGLAHQQLFMSMHWAGRFGGSAQANRVVEANFDPYSGQPAFKSNSVQVKPYSVEQYGLYIGSEWAPKDMIYISYQQTRQGVWRFATQAHQAKRDWLTSFQHVINLDIDGGWLAVHCAEHSTESSTLPNVMGILAISTEPLAMNVEGLSQLVGQPLELSKLIEVVGSQNLSKLVCSCFKITDEQIISAIESLGCSSLQQVQAKLKCGTNCGSCLPEVSRLVDESLKIEIK